MHALAIVRGLSKLHGAYTGGTEELAPQQREYQLPEGVRPVCQDVLPAYLGLVRLQPAGLEELRPVDRRRLLSRRAPCFGHDDQGEAQMKGRVLGLTFSGDFGEPMVVTLARWSMISIRSA